VSSLHTGGLSDWRAAATPAAWAAAWARVPSLAPPGPCFRAHTCIPAAPQLWTREGARGWSRGGGSGGGARLQAAGGAAPLFLGLHGEGRHKRLHDFDDHLNDLSKRAPGPPRYTTCSMMRHCGIVAGGFCGLQKCDAACRALAHTSGPLVSAVYAKARKH